MKKINKNIKLGTLVTTEAYRDIVSEINKENQTVILHNGWVAQAEDILKYTNKEIPGVYLGQETSATIVSK